MKQTVVMNPRQAGKSTMASVINRVAESLRNAKNNGHHFDGMTSRDIALNLIRYDSDLENELLHHVIRAVEIIIMTGSNSLNPPHPPTE